VEVTAESIPPETPITNFDEVFEIERKLSEKHRLNVAIAEYVSIDVG
jgi:hypothetical protein